MLERLFDWLPPLWTSLGIVFCAWLVARFFVFALRDLRRTPARRRVSFAVLMLLGTIGVFVQYGLAREYRARHWSVELKAREVVRRGDPAVLKLTWEPWPPGVNSMVEMWFRAVSLRVGGKEFPPALAGHVREIPDYATQGARSGYQVVELPAELAKLSDGPVPVECEVEVKTRYGERTSVRRVSVSTSFRLVPASVETVRVVTARPAGFEENRLGPCEVREYAGGLEVLVSERRSPRNIYRGLPYELPEPPPPPTVYDAGELSIQMGETVIPLGLYPQTDRFGEEYLAKVPAGEEVPAFVDLILTPSREAAVRTFDVDTIWGEVITLRVPVQRVQGGK